MLNFDTFKSELLTRQAELEARLQAIHTDVSHLKEPLSSDWSEQAVERENDEVLEALGKASQVELAQIKLALKRIEEGNYDRCSVCDANIPVDRLQLLPHTTYCTPCAEEIECSHR